MNKPQKEAIKEILRWTGLYAVSFLISWFVSQTLSQVGLVPEVLAFKVWLFTYLVPVRQMFAVGLTLIGRFVDKYLHELGKEKDNKTLKMGLTRF